MRHLGIEVQCLVEALAWSEVSAEKEPWLKVATLISVYQYRQTERQRDRQTDRQTDRQIRRKGTLVEILVISVYQYRHTDWEKRSCEKLQFLIKNINIKEKYRLHGCKINFFSTEQEGQNSNYLPVLQCYSVTLLQCYSVSVYEIYSTKMTTTVLYQVIGNY